MKDRIFKERGIYFATKKAVDILAKALHKELIPFQKTKVKIIISDARKKYYVLQRTGPNDVNCLEEQDYVPDSETVDDTLLKKEYSILTVNKIEEWIKSPYESPWIEDEELHF